MSRRSAGDAGDGLVYAFYNYHSVPISLNSIERLIRFVTSQLSITLIRFFFCCDVRLTPSEVLDCVQLIPGCEVSHFHFGSSEDLEQSIANRMLKHAKNDHDGYFALISGPGEYSNLLTSMGSQLSFFHPSNADTSSIACRRFELSKTLEMSFPSQTAKAVIDGKMNTVMQQLNDSLNKAIAQLCVSFGNVADADDSDGKTTKPIGAWAKASPGAKSKMAHMTPGNNVHSEMMKPSDESDDSYEKDYEETKAFERNRSDGPFAFPRETKEQLVLEKKNPFASTFEKPNVFGEKNHFTMGEGSLQIQNNHFDRPTAFAPQEKRNPFNAERPNPFEQANPFQYGSRGDQWDLEEPKAIGSLGRGQRNPFSPSAAPPPLPLGSCPFRKPAPQCPHWEDKVHRNQEDCQLWHPHKECAFFPKCRVMAAECGYAHPFCNDGECNCEGNQLDPQLNHFRAY